MKENNPVYLFSSCAESKSEAVRLGHRLYYGTACRKGHGDSVTGNRRYTKNGSCRACWVLRKEARRLEQNGGPKPMSEIDDLKEDADLAAELAEVWD
jgi:hypothetical protein